jgi:hypothetical protein
VEETKDTTYLVLPSASALGDQGGELSERELEAVAGGDGDTIIAPTCGVMAPCGGGDPGTSNYTGHIINSDGSCYPVS